MAEALIPLPPGIAPAGAVAWLSSHAERWRALRPGRWAHPFPTVVALVLASMAALRLAPQGAYFCDGKGPCTPDWLGTAMAALVVAVVYRGIRRLPLASAAVLPVVGIWALLDPGTPTAAGIAMAVAACYACLGCLHRLAAARRQRRLALEIAGPGRYPLPEAAMTRPGYGEQLGCGIVMVAAAGLAFILGPIGITPFMGTEGWQPVAFLATIIGLLSLAYYVRDRRRATALRRGPVPALHVLVREGGGRNDRRTYVFAVDDIEGRRPFLSCYTRLADRESRIPVHNRLREAVLFGPPHPGGGLVLVSCDGQETPCRCIEYDVGPARQEYPEHRPEPLHPGAAPLSWGPGIGSRLCAVLGQGILTAFVVADLTVFGGMSLEHRVYFVLFILGSSLLIATQFSWRITADSAGLWAVGTRRVRHIPWDELAQVWLKDRGFRIDRSGEGARGAEIYGVVAPPGSTVVSAADRKRCRRSTASVPCKPIPLYGRPGKAPPKTEADPSAFPCSSSTRRWRSRC
ncbi:hypothetical protein [Streptomyces sp. MBT84]|uniref:hypothetical protein n=1 Tax=Streptomyces sp. MBT84 TaxID=1488414 RepID=UPI001C6F39EF|nr:hypothetical protein [Streptomyces sp. MBT84]